MTAETTNEIKLDNRDTALSVVAKELGLEDPGCVTMDSTIRAHDGRTSLSLSLKSTEQGTVVSGVKLHTRGVNACGSYSHDVRIATKNGVLRRDALLREWQAIEQITAHRVEAEARREVLDKESREWALRSTSDAVGVHTYLGFTGSTLTVQIKHEARFDVNEAPVDYDKLNRLVDAFNAAVASVQEEQA